MTTSLKRGERVSWGTSQGKTAGKVVKKVTRTTRIKGHVAQPSADAPQYVVRSDKTGEKAIHRQKALRKR
jgi:Hypervirulence associated proteins TUDOR domain